MGRAAPIEGASLSHRAPGWDGCGAAPTARRQPEVL